MSGAIENLLGSPGTEARPSRPPSSAAKEAPHSATAVAERQTLEEHTGRPEPRAASVPARLPGQALSYKEFIRVVQELGAMESAGEAEAAARAALRELAGCVSWRQAQSLAAWLPKPLRELVSRRSFESSMSRFAPKAFLEGVAAQEGIGLKRAARNTRAVLLALDRTLPRFLTEQLHSELASLWVPLTTSEQRDAV